MSTWLHTLFLVSEQKGMGNWPDPFQGGTYNLQSISTTLRNRAWFTRLIWGLVLFSMLLPTQSVVLWTRPAQTDQRTPNKLRITIKLLITQKDEPIFITEWNKEIKAAEYALCKCLMDHLNRGIRSTQVDIRSMMDKTYKKVKQLIPLVPKP